MSHHTEPFTPRVKQILCWYAGRQPGRADQPRPPAEHGTLAGTGKLVILPVDQGFEHGPAARSRRTRRLRPALPLPARDRLRLQRLRGAARLPRGRRGRVRRRRSRSSSSSTTPTRSQDEQDPLGASPARSRTRSASAASAIGYTIYPGSADRATAVRGAPRAHRREAQGSRPGRSSSGPTRAAPDSPRRARPRST